MERKKWFMVAMTLLTLFVFANAQIVTAADDDDDDGVTRQEESMFNILFIKGGVIGGVIWLMSLTSVALVIEHFVNIKRDKLVPPEIIAHLESLLEEQEFDDVVALCEGGRNYISNILSAAIARIDDGFEAMTDAAVDATDEENLKLDQKISWIGLIGNIAPMCGLLGTVWGMIGAFQIIAQLPNPTPADLAIGVYTALVTTFLGLVVAIPVLCFYFHFRNVVGKLQFELGSIANEMVSKLRPLAEE